MFSRLALLLAMGLSLQAQSLPPGVELITDIAYDNNHEAQKLDLYLPPKDDSDGLRPAVVFVHGGGWRGGDKGGGQWRTLPAAYAADGFVAISVNYRLSDVAAHPAQINDVKAAVRWLRAYTQQYRVDPQRIGAYGNSAGAHLVTMLALTEADDGLESDGPNQDQSSAVQAVVSSATPTDFLHWPQDWNSYQVVSKMLGATPAAAPETAKAASPITYARADAPALLFLHGTADRTVPKEQTDRLVAALREAGAKEVRSLIFDGEGHGVFQSQRLLLYPAMRAFFRDALMRE